VNTRSSSAAWAVLPGNDDAIRAIQLYAGAIAKAVEDGKRASGNAGHAEEAAPAPAAKPAAEAAAPAGEAEATAAAAAEAEAAAASSGSDAASDTPAS